ncbi:MAG: glycosyl hydrolase family 88 [Lachnospiraceae bacterium]|nr:glycosyl hydrolase family 88 [Lachnospiraceae bacterium]
MQFKDMDLWVKSFYKDLSFARLDKWNYEDGCMLLAAIALYKATNEHLYKEFVIQYMEHYVTKEGDILHYEFDHYNLDNIAPARALLFAYEQTGEERYKAAADLLYRQLKSQPRTSEGNFWHKLIYPNQVWLDGLFMAQPFYMAYETRYAKKEAYNDILSQFACVRKHMFNEKKKLYYHGYDESRQMFWADKESGCSKNFWLRAIGWYEMALVDTMDEMSNAMYEYYRSLEVLFKESMRGILCYQDPKSFLFYQVVDAKEEKDNYLETSGSAMIAAAILKACRLKVVLSEKYAPIGQKIVESIVENKVCKGQDGWVLKDTCKVAGLGPNENRRDGSIFYYLSEPKQDNDKKGLAALFLAYAEYKMASGKEEEKEGK